MMVTEARNHEIPYSLPLLLLLLLFLKQNPPYRPFYLSQFGLFHPKARVEGHLGECFSPDRLRWVCNSAVSPGQTPSGSLLIGCQ